MAAKTTVKVSLTNNAAKDDYFGEANYDWLNEDGALKGDLNVLGNDPGSAKLLGVSDTVPTTSAELTQLSDTIWVTVEGLDDPVAISIVKNADGTVGFDASALMGKLDYLAAGETFEVSFYYTAQMANGTYSTAKVTVAIAGENDGPTIIATEPADLVEAGADGAGNANACVNLTLTDPEHDAVSYDVQALVDDGWTDNNDGTFTKAGVYGTATLDTNTDKVTYALDNGDEDTNALAKGQEESESFKVHIKDSHGATGSANVTFKVVGANDAPTVSDVAVPADEDGTPVVGSFSGDDVDNDDDGSSLIYTITSDPSEGSVVNNDDGTFSFDPGTDFQDLADGETRDVTFTYKATDGQGTDSGTGTVTVTVTGTDDDPVLAVSSTSANVQEGNTGTGIFVSATDADAVDNTLGDFNGDYVLGGADAGKFEIDGTTGELKFKVAPDYENPDDDGANRVYDVTVHAKDGNGNLSATETLAITVTDDPSDNVVFASLPPAYTGTGDPNDNDAASGVATVSLNPGGNANGGSAADVIVGNGNNNTLNGQGGNDTIFGAGGSDTINGQANDDGLYGQAGDDTISGGDGLDTAYGGSGNDAINGGDGDDTLYGGSGTDNISGGAGADVIVGGYGADVIDPGGAGGDGAVDTIRYLSLLDTGDTINNFISGQDKIDLSQIDADTSDLDNDMFLWGGEQAGPIVEANSVTWYLNGSDVVLLADTDGDLTNAEFSVTLAGISSIADTDFNTL